MPFISVRLVAGRSTEAKQELARRISEDVQDVLQVKPEAVWITFEEIPGADWSIGGNPLSGPVK